MNFYVLIHLLYFFGLFFRYDVLILQFLFESCWVERRQSFMG